MTKQFVLTRLSLSGLVVGVLIVGLAVGFATQSGQRGPEAPAAPCGPSIVGELGTNTATNSRCFELRMYTVDTSKSRINDLHKRFRDGEVAIFRLGYVTRLMILGQKFALSRVSLYRVESVPSGEYP